MSGETHKFVFKDYKGPAVLLNMLRGRNITATEFALIHVIDALVRTDGTGCYATNQYLANAVGINSGVRVSNMLTKLTRMRLVKRKISDKAGLSGRFLWVNWGYLYRPEIRCSDVHRVHSQSEGGVHSGSEP